MGVCDYTGGQVAGARVCIDLAVVGRAFIPFGAFGEVLVLLDCSAPLGAVWFAGHLILFRSI